MNIYEEAINNLFVVMHEITRDEDDLDGLSIYEIVDKLKSVKQALKRAKKVEELLVLYQLQQEFKERYNTQVRVLDRQKTIDVIREIAEEIYLKEKELEEEE